MIELATPLRVLIAEDHELARTGLSFAIQSNPRFTVVGEAIDGVDTLKKVEELQPDVILMDISMPVMDGITATQQIKETYNDIKVIILTSQVNREMVLASLSAGAEAYCLKDIRIEHLFSLMEMIADGGVWLDPNIARIVLESLPGGEQPDQKPLTTPANGTDHYNSRLTERELEVLGFLVEGKSNKEIAPLLNISPHTVKTYVCNILQKLAVDDRTQAAVKALQQGLISTHPASKSLDLQHF